MDEIKVIPGFSGYGTTRDGRVFTRKSGGTGADKDEWRPLAIKKLGTSSPYLAVAVSIDGKSKWRVIHRLVYMAWVGEIPPRIQIDHVDGNRFNNLVSNLEAVTPRENTIRAVKNGLWRSRVGDLNPNSRARRALRGVA